ncbi:hypothetical protein PFICI_05644 [Pestalotiopsis fici W106-1]|uniref:DNA mismatch repair protein PMS1 n=1 Tax=Pestalotiopsis fici (strain W106-1 / CGMCC3.15140) TaxID=1229662 RepID=W3XCG0_PESFW|nr:uncharacterized protein PFICI_05644 [Pestalotiopsis fici W106-1]ETS83768.1 hypothetical protein PFICI_05644 [Pestalotiopsis fici W106-1]
MATIKAIEARTVHQIQSGQVIVDLCSVVKELVENSVDAGATNIEVRFKNQGLDSIEVQDNGGGIAPDNYETLALKHYTSKLSTYEDLASLETFGFRGEALSSLCALSKFSVLTCLASDAPKGTRLEFEISGTLRGTSVVAAQKGTTVVVEDLFNNLPVRRRELQRNIKREWNKVIGLLNQYACILTRVKFSVSQQPNKGKKIILFSTKGNATTRENIVNVFGAKTLTVLIPLELDLELEPTTAPSQRLVTKKETNTKEVKIRGHVSRPAHGEGRQTPDRQMFFVNGRPCGLPQFAKVFNEVYKSYNSSQSPFICADIQLDTHMYDVNVSPDKRTILLHDQSRLLDNLRESLIALFEVQDYSVPASQLNGPKQAAARKLAVNRQNTVESEPRSNRSTSMNPKNDDHNDEDEVDTPTGQNPDEDETVGDQQQNRGTSYSNAAQSSEGPTFISRWLDKRSTDRPQGPGVPKPIDSTTSDITRSSQITEGNSLDHKFPEKTSLLSPQRAGFVARLDELSRNKASTETVDIDHENQATPESPIPSVGRPSRTSEIKNVQWSPRRFKRTAPEIATITIDGETVTSIIGSPAKKVRTERSNPGKSHEDQSTAQKAAQMPSFKGRLTQMFSASSSSHACSEGIGLMPSLGESPRRSRSPSTASAASEGLFVESDKDADEEPASPISEAKSGQIETHASGIGRGTPAHSAISRETDSADAYELELSNSNLPVRSEQEFADEAEQKAQEEDRVRDMIDSAEDVAKITAEESQKRQQTFVKGMTRRKDATCQFMQKVRTNTDTIAAALSSLDEYSSHTTLGADADFSKNDISGEDAEEKLSLTISKSDFDKMKIVGQFNLGFILAIRYASRNTDDAEDWHAVDDELFIIDQHATDEKYNFERLQATTVVQSQRLVQPKALELTAIEEEVIKENIEALESNGFQVSIDESGYQPVGSRCQLLSLPLSRETTFTLADLEELISLLTDHQSTSVNTIPRPSKVRKMFAMRACRSSVMIGKSLSNKQMEKLVRHMGELDKPWNCPHGRPTMRHLCGLGAWNDSVWQEGDGPDGEPGTSTNWSAYLKEQRTSNPN